MPPVTEWECNLGYITLRGLTVGQADKWVFALHGYLDNANSMIDLYKAFPNTTFVAIDLAGHGKSDHRPAGVHYNLMDYVQDLHQLCITLQAQQVILLGHSLGGIICSIYASLFPETVLAVINIDSLGPLTKPAHTSHEQLQQAILSRSKKMLVAQSKLANLKRAASIRASKTDLSESNCQYILRRNITNNAEGEQVWGSDSRLITPSLLRLTEQQVENILRNIQCPMLVIGASNSFKNLPEAYQQRKHWIGDAAFHVLQGGHHIHLERIDETVAIIGEFVSKM